MAGEETQTHVSHQGQAAHPPARPPYDVPGYSAIRFLGSGAFGEVWVAQDNTTGRKVAIKFLLHRLTVDSSLLTREVEKLVFLSADRYVVQLLDVGWDAEPPYFVMEYLERGSLEEYLDSKGALPVVEAVHIFRDVATGLSHAHSKGILHCDLKPANLLLDQDGRPRLADFGQARLASEQNPALGTLFYMAPEQADLQAVPDASWDVYALGCLLHTMLIGRPPYRSEESLTDLSKAKTLEQRLERYRNILHNSPPPTAHRKIRGVDRPLAEILERCLAVDSGQRFGHVLGVLEALAARDQARLRRPLWLLGIVGPLLLLLTVGMFGYRVYDRAIRQSQALATTGAEESNRFAAIGAARNVANEIEQRFRALGAAARNAEFVADMSGFVSKPEIQRQLAQLADPANSGNSGEALRDEFKANPARESLAAHLETWLNDVRMPSAASWIVTSSNGTMLATAFEEPPAHPPEGENFSYRTYFHGGDDDLEETDRTTEPLTEVHVSAPFQSTATGDWKVAISTPVIHEDQTVGVLAMTVILGGFVQFSNSDTQCALLVDGRGGKLHGIVLQHPIFTAIRDHGLKLPNLSDYKVDVDRLQDTNPAIYQDPLSTNPMGHEFVGDWIVASAPVEIKHVTRDDKIERSDTGLMLLVQKRLDAATTLPVLRLGKVLVREAMLALLAVVGVVIALWYLVGRSSHGGDFAAMGNTENVERKSETIHSRETLEHPFPEKLK